MGDTWVTSQNHVITDFLPVMKWVCTTSHVRYCLVRSCINNLNCVLAPQKPIKKGVLMCNLLG